MHELGKLAVENMAKINSVEKETSQIRDDTDKKVRHIKYDIYEKKIRALQEKCDAEVDQIQADGKAAEAINHDIVVELNKPVLQIKLILDFLRLDRNKDLAIPDDEVSFNDYHKDYYKEALGYHMDDTYLKIKLFIVQNSKPTNKYSLIAIGKCLFYEELLKLPRYYGGDFPPTTWRLVLEAGLKDAPTIEQLKAWLAKNREKLFPPDFYPKYLEVKTAYDQAIHDYKPDDFEEFLLARCPCGNFYTVWEDYIRRENPVTCSQCKGTMALTANHITIGR